MSFISRKAFPIPLKELAFGSITASYSNLGSVLPSPLVMIIVKNNTDQTLYVSFDGTNNHFKLPSGNFDAVDIQANSTIIHMLQKGLQISVKHAGVEPTSGEIIVQGWRV